LNPIGGKEKVVEIEEDEEIGLETMVRNDGLRAEKNRIVTKRLLSITLNNGEYKHVT